MPTRLFDGFGGMGLLIAAAAVASPRVAPGCLQTDRPRGRLEPAEPGCAVAAGVCDEPLSRRAARRARGRARAAR